MGAGVVGLGLVGGWVGWGWGWGGRGGEQIRKKYGINFAMLPDGGHPAVQSLLLV